MSAGAEQRWAVEALAGHQKLNKTTELQKEIEHFLHFYHKMKSIKILKHPQYVGGKRGHVT